MPKRDSVVTGAEDETCEVWCHCGYEAFVGSEKIYRCPNCGRGYRVEFVVWEYGPDEHDEDYPDIPEIRSWGDGFDPYHDTGGDGVI